MNILGIELERRKSTTARMLAAFKKNKVLTTADIRKYGTGCSSRLHELRADGHKISAVYEKPGFYRYIYAGQETELPDNWSEIKRQASEGDDSKLAVID